MKFKVKNSNIFPIPKNPHMLHLGTIEYGLREFIVMLCVWGEKSGKCYIEEVVLTTVDYTKDVFANLKFIQDDNLANDLAMFAEQNGLTDIKRVKETLIDRRKDQWISRPGLKKS